MISAPKFVDAHIHLSDEEYKRDTNQIMEKAKDHNVVAMVSNSTDLETSQESLRLAERYPNLAYAALGIHPWNVNTVTETELQRTIELILGQKASKEVVAIGEIGLEHKYMKVWDKQIKVFDRLLQIAERLSLPVIVHFRGTTAMIIDIFSSYKLRKILLHWFSSPISGLSRALEEGYYISEGVPTIFSNGIRAVVKKTPLTDLLTETDGPVRFFRPPINGRKTTPALIPAVVEAIADIKKTDTVTVADQIALNFKEFFGTQID